MTTDTIRSRRKYSRSREYWEGILKANNNDIDKVIQSIGISRGYFYDLMKRLNIESRRDVRRISLEELRPARPYLMRNQDSIPIDWSDAPIAKAFGLPWRSKPNAIPFAKWKLEQSHNDDTVHERALTETWRRNRITKSQGLRLKQNND